MGSPPMEKLPEESDWAVRLKPVPVLVTVSCTVGMAAWV